MSLLTLLRRFGNTGAVANAEVELHLARRRERQADAVVGRVAAAEGGAAGNGGVAAAAPATAA